MNHLNRKFEQQDEKNTAGFLHLKSDLIILLIFLIASFIHKPVLKATFITFHSQNLNFLKEIMQDVEWRFKFLLHSNSCHI